LGSQAILGIAGDSKNRRRRWGIAGDPLEKDAIPNNEAHVFKTQSFPHS